MNATNIDPRYLEIKDKAIGTASDQITDPDVDRLDNEWIKSAFLISDTSLLSEDPDTPDGSAQAKRIGSHWDVANRYWSSADAKFTDSRLGCNIGINARPQFTRYSDIRSNGRKHDIKPVSPSSNKGPFGMGRYYSEAIDDPSQTIYLRFGVPQFNSLTSFIANAFHPDMVSLGRTGKSSGLFYNVGKAIGTITTAVAFPAVAAFVFAGRALSWIFSRPVSKFYTMKPTMHLYWSAVNSLVNNVAINRGIFPKVWNSDEQAQKLGQGYTLDQDYMNALQELMPDVFRGQNWFDMYALANRAQMMANRVFVADYEALNNGTPTDYKGYLYKQLTGTGAHETAIGKKGSPTFMEMIQRAVKMGTYFTKDDAKETTMEKDPRISEDGKTVKETPSSGFWDFFDAEFSDGSQFAIFKVDHTGSVSESFANSATESDLSNKVNSLASQARQARFTFADGNFAGDTMKAVTDSVVGLAEGALSGITLGFSDVISGLVSGGYIDIPKTWQSSSASLPRSSYNIKLISPYGNAISQMQNIYIPLCMLLAATLPMSYGKASYGSPFLCELYDRGRQQVKLGMIESLSINRGTSNLAFTTKGTPLEIDISFTIADLSSIMHMPISSGSIFTADSALDQDNILVDYLAVLAGQDLYSQFYAIPKAKLRLAKSWIGLQKVSSPAFWASAVHESLKTGMVNDLTLGASGVITTILEGVSRSNALTKGDSTAR